jgi:hypothetical protein
MNMQTGASNCQRGLAETRAVSNLSRELQDCNMCTQDAALVEASCARAELRLKSA